MIDFMYIIWLSALADPVQELPEIKNLENFGGLDLMQG